MALTIDNLEIQIQVNAKKASSGIDALEQSLTKLSAAVGGASGLASNLTQISNALKTFSSVGKINMKSPINQLTKLKELIPVLGGNEATQLAQNLREMSGALASFSTVPKINIAPIASGIKSLNEATASMDKGRLKEFSNQMKGISSGLSQLGGVGKTNINSVVNAVKKIPEITQNLSTEEIERFAIVVKRLTEIMEPLAVEMDSIARGFNAMPGAIKRANAAMDDAASSAQKTGKANTSLLQDLSQVANQYKRLYQVIDRAVDMFAEWFEVSNDYVEALNLFKVSMGDASAAALEYAEAVGAAMGIDPAEWIENQGIFQRMATGFGVASEEAEIMSQNLTQLAYDMSSFFNTNVQTAMDKLQSGMSGQIKGLKEWGYNLSVAALQETALSLGIEQSVRSMSEAQKAQLRYITLIQRSNGVMGDMGKTINTPANALRVLNAQITQLKRSLGKIVSVVATQVIPYVQAFVELIAEAAEALADAWGFEIKEMDTSNLEMASDVINGIGDDTENTIDDLAKLKKQLMGFDELNVLNSSDSDEDKTSALNSLNIDLPEYDFLSAFNSETREHIDAIKEEIKELIPVLEGVAQAFAIAFAVRTFLDAKNALSKFFGETKLGIGIAQMFNASFGDFFALAKKNGVLKTLGTSIKNLGKNFKSAMSSLSPFTKAMVSFIALGVEYQVVNDAIYDLTMGHKNFGEAMGAIIPVCGAVGVAMYAMLGPFGLVTAAVVGVTAGLVGFIKAEDELRKQLVHDSFYDNYGTSVSELATKFEELMDSTTEAYQPINDMNDEISNSKASLDETKQSVNLLIEGVENGVTPVEEACEKIVEALKSIYNDTNKYLTGTRDLVLYALTGSLGEGLGQLGLDTSEMLAASGKITQGGLEKVKEIKAENEKLFAELEKGGVSDARYKEIWTQLTENYSLMASYSGGTNDKTSSAVTSAKTSLAEALKDINWDSDNLESELARFVAASDKAKSQITSAYEGIIEAFESQKLLADKAGDKASVAIFEKAIAGTKTVMQGDLDSIDKMLFESLGGFQTNLITEFKNENVSAGIAWKNMGLIEQMTMYGTFDNYLSSRLKDYQNLIEPTIEALEKAFGAEKIYVDDVIQAVGEGMYEGGFENDWWTNHKAVAGHWGFYEELEKAMETAGVDTVEGLISGLTSEQKTVYDEGRAMGLSILDAYDKALDIHSPSVEMEKRGEYTIQGLVNGLSDTTMLDKAIKNITDKFDILPDIKSVWGKVTDWWKNLSLPEIGSKLAKLNIGGYASGGFPSVGQMFIARERGPELVGRIGNKNAVANNDQIITGIASAVYSAMIAAKEDGDSGNDNGGNARIIVQIGDKAVGEASVRYINGQIVQTGTSPIYS